MENRQNPSDPGAGACRRIEVALAAAFAALPPGETLRAARYATLGGGRRWRARLAVAAGAAFCADAERRVRSLAVALEMLHAASLTLDDLPSMDNALTRRGKACVHLVFPPWVVDMLPAFLVNRAYQVVADDADLSAESRIRVLQLLGEMGGNLARGQEMDLGLTRRPVSAAVLLECYALKSGSLFAAALAGGGGLGGAGAADVAALRAAGLKLGQAFQILDDLADGPEEDGAYRDAGRETAYSLWGPAAARARAESMLAEVRREFARLGPAAAPLRELLEELWPSGAG